MNKNLKQIETIIDLVEEYAFFDKNLESLPVGYISVKQISGKTYYYRQWREGNRIISEYVPETKLVATRRKIAFRKNLEVFLKDVKKDLKKATRQAVKAELLTEVDVEDLKQAAVNGEDVYALAEQKLAK